MAVGKGEVSVTAKKATLIERWRRTTFGGAVAAALLGAGLAAGMADAANPIAGLDVGPDGAPIIRMVTPDEPRPAPVVSFVDESGKSWGPIDKFGLDKAVVLDNLSGLNTMSMNLATGGKPIKSQPDWGKAMDYEERIITACTSIIAPFVLIGHVEREVNEVSGSIDVMVGALGRKLAPKLPRLFSDVIYAQRRGENRLPGSGQG